MVVILLAKKKKKCQYITSVLIVVQDGSQVYEKEIHAVAIKTECFKSFRVYKICVIPWPWNFKVGCELEDSTEVAHDFATGKLVSQGNLCN